MPDKKLQMTFDPNTIQHLGIKMYSRLANALAELVANAYDADAENVIIKLNDVEPDKFFVEIEDDGIGMSFDDINNCFLKIGRTRRKEDKSRRSAKGRAITGKKGLGKLALFGIGQRIEISTTQRGCADEIHFIMDWNIIMGRSSSSTGGNYEPEYVQQTVDTEKHGTKIILTQLKRKSKFEFEKLCDSLAGLFNFCDNNFRVQVIYNDDASEDLNIKDRYLALGNRQFSWEVKDLCVEINDDYEHKNDLNGIIYSTTKPAKSNFRGITLYSNGRMINNAGFFGCSEAPIALSYITGWISADFVDEEEEDLISTDRQSIEWDSEKGIQLQRYLAKLVNLLIKKWNDERKKVGRKRLTDDGFDVDKWTSTMREDLKKDVDALIDTLVVPADSGDISKKAVEKLHDIIPPYPYYHFRHLCADVKDASKDRYQNADYYEAFRVTAIRYINSVAKKSGKNNDKKDVDGRNLISNVFNEDGNKGILNVVGKYSGNEELNKKIFRDIRMGHKDLSLGMISGGRNVLSHEENCNLRETGIFTEDDCLDMLSLLSHLFKRLNEATIVKNEVKK